MHLIIGEKSQRKLRYAMEKYGFSEKDVWDASIHAAEFWDEQKLIYHAEELVRQWVYAGADALEAASHIIPLWKDSVIITQEIQSFSPETEEERQWREAVIQVNALLMTYADTVERVRNGVATNLKS